MAHAKPLRTSEPQTTVHDIVDAYPELSGLLQHRLDEIVPLESAARANLDEQIMDSPGDEADASVVDANADYFLMIANAHQHEVMEIREAQDRMAKGAYGICETCEEPIALERLKHLPTARMCVDCQSSVEKAATTAFPMARPKL